MIKRINNSYKRTYSLRFLHLFILILLVPASTIYSQKKADHFTVFDESDGLVKAVVSGTQDQQGFLWFGTEGNNGVYRYDGNEFRQYKHNPSLENSIVPGNIYSIITDKKGCIWFASDGGGLSCYNPRSEEFINFTHSADNPVSLADNTIYSLLEDRSGNIWVATAKSLDRYSPETEIFTHFYPELDREGKLSSSIIFHLYESRDGTIWIGTLGGGLNAFDPEKEQFSSYMHDPNNPGSIAHNTCGAIVEDNSGRIWVGGKGGLNLLDRETGIFTHFKHDPDDLTSIAENFIWDIKLDENDNLWLGGYGGGLGHFNSQTGEVKRFMPDPADSGSLSSNLVFFLMVDRGGILWIGTGDGGLNKYIPLNEQFQHYRHIPGDPNSFTATSLFTIYQSSDEFIWVGGQGHQAGLSRWDRKEGILKHYLPDENNPNSLPAGEVAALLETKNGDFYIGQQGRLSKFDRKNEKFLTLFPGVNYRARFRAKVIYHLVEDTEGNIWMATEIGLIRYNPSSDSFNFFLEDTPIKTLYIDNAGVLWVGTSSEGIIRFDMQKGTGIKYQHDPLNTSSLQSGEISTIVQDSKGRIWVSTSGGGLNLWISRNEGFFRFNQENGFSDNIIFSILEDKQGYLWMGSSNGLIQYHPVSKTLINYTISDGLQGNEFSIRQDNAFEGVDGLFYFIGKGGVTVFDPISIRRNENPPPIVLTSFRIYNREVDLGGAPFALNGLNLSWQDSMITFDYAALDFHAPQMNQYSYMMEGFDDEWIPAGEHHSATYTNLDGGNYTFRIIGSNNHGVWNSNGISLDIDIIPPWWKTQLFYMFTILMIFAFSLLIIFYVWKLNNEIQEHKKSDYELKKMQNYLSDIINSMPSILVAVDKELRVILWNSTSLQKTKIRINSALGKDVTVILPILEALKGSIKDSILNKEYKEIRKTPQKYEGHISYLNITIYPLSGENEGAVIRIDDVTKQVRVEEMMIQSEKMHSVGGLAAGMAHEINNPLGGILLSANLIKSRLIDDYNIPGNLIAAKKAGVPIDGIVKFIDSCEIPQMLDMISDSSERVAKIIDNMLSFSRKGSDNRSTHDLTDILDKAIELAVTDYDLKKKFDFRSIDIYKEYSPDMRPVICESSKIQQVFLNILRNGAQAMQSVKTKNPKFIFRTGVDSKSKMVFLEIEDNGPGMSEEVRKRIFEPFFTTKDVGAGTGLGMSVSYFIICENHQGEMRVESKPGKGAKFIIRLPE